MATPEPAQPVDLATRPFLADLQPTTDTPAPPSSGLGHLYDAVTRTRPQRHTTPDRSDTPRTPASTTHAAPDRAPAATTSDRPTMPARSALLAAPSSVEADWQARTAPDSEDVDWALVRAHVLELDVPDGRTRADFDVATASALPETAEEHTGWAQLEALLDRHITGLVLTLGEAADWSPGRRARQVQAGFDAAFRYGRLSALLREDAENIDVLGYDHTWVTLPDGTKHRRAPIADSDADLEQLIADVAEDRGRPFARPHGTVRVDIGGARLTALGGPQITPRPRLAIRKHRLVDIALTDLVDDQMLTPRMSEFLTCSIRAYRSHLIAGYAASGKTTFLRALASALPASEPIVTIETERELYLDKLPKRHWIVDPLQYLPAVQAGDDRDAAFPLDTAIEYALRLNAQVILFGEILGPLEAASAIKALQAGKGASSTIHAESTNDALQRFSTALTQAGRMSDDAVAQQQIMNALDLVIQLDLLPATPIRPRRRIVTEIAEVVPGDAPASRMQRPITRTLWRLDPETGRHQLGEPPSAHLTAQLVRAGLAPDFFSNPAA